MASIKLSQIPFQGNEKVFAASFMIFTALGDQFFIMMSKGDNGKINYSVITLNFMVELTKLCVAMTWYLKMDGGTPAEFISHMLNMGKSLPYLVPAIMYAVQNANTVWVLQYISPANFQFFSVLKIVFTALMFRLVFAKRFFDTQWIGVILLVCAMLTSSMDKYYGSQSQQQDGDSELSNLYIGAAIVVVNCMLSAGSTIYVEFMLKKRDEDKTLMFKNACLYSYGLVANLAFRMYSVTTQDDSGSLLDLSGFTFAVWMLILNRAMLGTSISLVMKYADSVIKTFVGSACLYLSAIMDATLFGKPLTAATLVGGVTFTAALYLYMIEPEQVKPHSTGSLSPRPEMMSPKLVQVMSPQTHHHTSPLKHVLIDRRGSAGPHDLKSVSIEQHEN